MMETSFTDDKSDRKYSFLRQLLIFMQINGA